MKQGENPAIAGTPMEQTVETLKGLLFGDEEKAAPETPPEAPAEAETAEAPEAEAPAEAPEATEEAPTKRSRKLRFGDEEIEVDEDEAYNGYLRQKDYTRKTQLAAEQRKKAEAEHEEARKARDEYSRQLETLGSVMDSWFPKEPNWAEAARTLPSDEYQRMHGEWTTFQRNRQAVEAEREKVRKEHEADLARQQQEMYQTESERLLEKLPEWRDESVRTKEQAELRGWLKGQGWKEEEIGLITDHRHIITIRNAMRYEALQTKPEIKEKKPVSKTATPGPASPPRPKSDRQRDLERLKKTGKMDDARTAFLNFVD